jgi:hypothetical protein
MPRHSIRPRANVGLAVAHRSKRQATSRSAPTDAGVRLPTQMDDPNWFYSTLAQSAAAIVGVSGGFLASSLIRQREVIAERRQELLDRISSFRTSVENLRGLGDRLVQGVDRLRAEPQPETGSLRINPNSLGLGTFSMQNGPAGFVDVSPEDLMRFDALRVIAKEFADAAGALANPGALEDALFRRSGLTVPEWLNEPFDQSLFARDQTDQTLERFMRIGDQRNAARAFWQGIPQQYSDLSQLYESFRAAVTPRSSYALLGLLAGLLIAGVVLPMMSLSAKSGGSKAALLVVFALLAMGVLVYLAFEVTRLRAFANLRVQRTL